MLLSPALRWSLVAVAILVLSGFTALAQDAAPAKPPVFKEHLVIPEGTPEDTLAFFERLKQQKPKFENEQQARAHVQRVYETIAAGSAKALAGKITPDQEKHLTAAHFEALVILNRLKDARAAAPMLALAEKLKQSKDGDLADYARMQLLQLHLDAALLGQPGGAARLMKELKAYCSARKPSGERLDTLRTVARTLEIAGQYDAALQTYDLMNDTFHHSGNAELASAAAGSSKAARARLGVVGQKIQIESTTLDGKPFDLTTLAGKVVLVDFWATWCGPCVREMPNLKKNYEKYHERGFEVVGISLDEDRTALQSFLKDSELPWITLFSDNTQATQALADRFGVEGIPAMMLVGRDGKVVTLKARGDDLGKELERLLGPTPEATEPKK